MVNQAFNTVENAHFDRERPDIYGDAHPKSLLKAIYEDGEVLKPLENSHIVSIDQLTPEILLQLFRLAAKYESNPERFSTALQGKILISAFYEPSTRTRLSFESAWHRLGGDIMSITDRSTTGIAKGESLEDVAEMFNNYGDCVVLRDSQEDSVHKMMSALRIPIINAGNGIDEHPTQAMADLYTIFKWKPELIRSDLPAEQRIRIGIFGVPSKMRTVRSLLKIIAHFPSMVSEICIIHDRREPEVFSTGQREALEAAGLTLSVHCDHESVLPTLDVVYINAIAWIGDDYETFGNDLKLSKDSPFKTDAIILHPLARGEELATDLDSTPHNWYFSQARGAVFLRRALLTCLVQRAERVIDVI